MIFYRRSGGSKPLVSFMINTTLRAYLDELNLLLEQEALEEVMGHCRHILQHFPKNVEIYRLLGRALLEKNRHPEAADVFERVLSALPNDFVAHLGMSSIAEEQGQLPNAIWHIERAYEQQPNNPALQAEIKRLIEKRDGMQPERVQLTQGGLATLYAKGRLYEQAITELNNALQQMPERVDLELLLAQVLWESERPVEAAETALQVLDKLPDSLEANTIMASLWLQGGRPSDAAPFVTRLEQLDPFLAWATVNPDGKELPRNAFQLPRLDWDARAAAVLSSGDAPAWADAISNAFESPQSVSLMGGVTNWLESAVPNATPTPAPSSSPKSSLLSAKMAEVASEDDEVPDWFKGVDLPSNAPAPANSAIDLGQPRPPVVTSTSNIAVPSWLDDALPSQPQDDEQLPSGFTDLLANRNTGATSRSSVENLEMPDWLADVEPKQSPAALDAMSWLATGPLTPPEEMMANPAPTTAETASNTPDWLVDAEPAQTPEALDAMSWLSTGPLTPVEDETPAAQAEYQDNTVDDEMSWLSGVPETPAEESPAEMLAAPEFTNVNADQGLEFSSDAGDFSNLNDLFADSFPSPAAEPADQTLDWSANRAEPDPEITASMFEMDAAEPTDNIPDWMRNSMPDSESQSESAAQEDHPAWMSLDSTPQSELDSSPTAEDDAFAWMQGDSNAPVESEPSQYEAELSTTADWFGSATQDDPQNSTTEDDPLAWMQSDTNSTVASEPEAMAEDNDPLAWMRGGETSSTPEPEMVASDDDPLAWMQSDANSTVESEPEAMAEDNDPLAWMRGGETSSTPEPEMVASDDDPLAWMQSDTNSTVASEPEATTEDNDPLAWMHTYSIESEDAPQSEAVSDLSDGSDFANWATGTAQDQEDEALSPGDAPDWLSRMAPSSSGMAAESTFSNDLNNLTDSDDLNDLGFANLSSDESSGTLDWTPAVEASSATSQESAGAELEDEWLASFESSSETQPEEFGFTPTDANVGWQATSETPPVTPSPDQPKMQPTAEEDWLGSLASGNTAETGSLAPSGDDWFTTVAADTNWLTSSTPEPASTASTGQPLDMLVDFGAEDTDEPALATGDAPDWLSNMAPASSAAPSASLDDLDFGSFGTDEADEPALAAGDAPDWLSNMAPASAAAPSASLDDFDFGSFGTADTDEPALAAGDAPDWLSNIAPASAATPAPSASLDDFDFSSFGTDEADEPVLAAGDAPDWLSNMAPASAAEIDEVEPLGARDLTPTPNSEPALPPMADAPDWLSAFSMDDAETSAQTASTANVGQSEPANSSSSAGSNFDTVAQPANLVNTSSKSSEGSPSFSFDRAPAWMRKKKTSDGGRAAQAPKNQKDDTPDWLK
ncbi:MAG: tetratricopeptide repeat protein [Chloroflexota bacterium]